MMNEGFYDIDDNWLKRVIQVGEHTFDGNGRNFLVFENNDRESVSVRVNLYYPEHRGYLYGEILLARNTLADALNGIYHAGGATSMGGLEGGFITIGREIFGPETFIMSTDRFPGLKHTFDESLFGLRRLEGL